MDVVHGFLPSGRVFASYHRPAASARAFAFVICPPLGWEAIQCYHSLRLLGETLAGAGFPTLRLDYDGTGESIGSDDDPGRVAAWIGSIEEAVEALRSTRGVEAVGLVGLRMGATLAATTAARHRVDALVLWEPCRTGSSYTRELEIVASATRKTIGARGSSSPRSGAIEAAGYLLTPETVTDLAALSLDGIAPVGAPSVLIVRRDDRPVPPRAAEAFEAAGCTVAHVVSPGYKEMMVYPLKSKPPMATFERIRSWALDAKGDALTIEAPGTVHGLRPESSSGGPARRALRFGGRDRLFGVVTEPRDPVPTTVLLLSGGIVPRTAVNRMYVDLAERLAGAGHRVLRFDVSGIAESRPAPREAPNDAYPAALIDDIRSAIDEVTHRDPDRPVWMVGLCSGAYGAFQHALDDCRHVAGITLINPLEFYPRPGLSFANESGSRRKGAGVRAGLVHGLSQLGQRVGWRRRRLRNDICSLVKRGVGLDIAFSEGDPGRDIVWDALGDLVEGLVRDGMRLRVYPESDHTFNAIVARTLLLDWIVEGITGR